MDRASKDNPHYYDFESAGGKIRLRRECIGELGKWVEGEYWHLNRSFEGRSLFFGSEIDPFIDPYERFLVLRDAAVILLLDYRDGRAWHAQKPWIQSGGLDGCFPRVSFNQSGVAFDWSASARESNLDDFLVPGLGPSHDGFLTHWRPSPETENEYSLRLKMDSIILGTENR